VVPVVVRYFYRRLPVPLGVRLYYYKVWLGFAVIGLFSGVLEIVRGHDATFIGLLLTGLWVSVRIWLLGFTLQTIAWFLDYSEAV
jgi:hypothetical protein